MIYELRIYHAFPGRLPALNARFSNHTLKLWERFGIRQVGFWTTVIGESNNDLYYILEWENLARAGAEVERFRDAPRLAGDTCGDRERRAADDSHHQSDSDADRVLENAIVQLNMP